MLVLNKIFHGLHTFIMHVDTLTLTYLFFYILKWLIIFLHLFKVIHKTNLNTCKAKLNLRDFWRGLCCVSRPLSRFFKIYIKILFWELKCYMFLQKYFKYVFYILLHLYSEKFACIFDKKINWWGESYRFIAIFIE